MGSELPVLEYARVERVGGGDRYRLGFLLAGVPGIVALCLPIGLFIPLVWEVMRALRAIFYGGFSSRSMLYIGMITAFLVPLSAMVWRVLRLRGGNPGRIVGIIGLTFAGIHVAGIWGLFTVIVLLNGWKDRMVVAAVCVALVVCGGFMWRSRTRLDLTACVLLVLVGVEMAFWLLIGLLALAGLINGWGLVFVATAVVRGFEFAHVLRSRRLVEERV